MQIFLFIFLLYSTPLWAGLGDPYTYTLPTPPNPSIPPLPEGGLSVPTHPTVAPTQHTEISEPFEAKLDSLRRMKKKIRVQNAQGIEGLSALCSVKMTNHLCQANSIHILTDQDELLKSPLERYRPVSYIAISGFTDYFDLRIQGNTPCEVTVSCEYVIPQK